MGEVGVVLKGYGLREKRVEFCVKRFMGVKFGLDGVKLVDDGVVSDMI